MRVPVVCLCAGFLLLLASSSLYAQTPTIKLCVFQQDEGRDALQLAQALSRKKLKSGASLAVVGITTKALSPEGERRFTASDPPFVHVLSTQRTAKARSTELESLGCDYNIKVWYHRAAEVFDSTPVPDLSPSPLPVTPGPQPNEDRATVDYELRKASNNKLLVRSSAPPRTIYVKQGRRLFDPYSLFADQIIKKLDRLAN
jgi:hypothetical protein